MTEAPSLEELITARILNSAIGIADGSTPQNYGVYIDNPVASITKPANGGVGRVPKGGMKKTPYLDVAPSWDLLRPDPLPGDRQKVLGAQGKLPQADRIKYYLDWGADRARTQPFLGVCESFNAIVLAMFMAGNSPVPFDTVIEYIGMQHQAVGHAICAIHRNNMTQDVGTIIDTPLDTWGADCIIVDQWYALQAGCGPVFHVQGAHADAGYVGWVRDGAPALTMCGRLTVGSVRRPNIPLGRTARAY